MNTSSYYVNPANSDFAKADLRFTTDGETNLVGVHVGGNYDTFVSEISAVTAVTMFAEYIDGIAVAKIDDTPTLGTLTFTTSAGKDGTHTKIENVTPEKEAAGNVYKYKVGKEPAYVAYGQNVKTWKTWDGKSEIEVPGEETTITLAETDSAYKVQACGNTTIKRLLKSYTKA